jgi:hypothetical protein
LKNSRKTVLSPRRSVGLIAWALGKQKMKRSVAVAERLAHGELLRVQIEDLPTAELADPWEAMIGSSKTIARPYSPLFFCKAN